MKINDILNAKSLSKLLDVAENFCKNAIVRDDDSECMKLKEKLEQAADNDYLTMLSAYMSAAENGDELVDAIYEFVGNCRTFTETDKENATQITKGEFEAVLDECEDKCGIESYMEFEGYTLKIAEVPMIQKCQENLMKFKGNNILLCLPMVDKNIDIKQYIAEEIGGILYETVIRKLKPDIVLQELHRYIPETRKSNESAKQLFRKYFYSVVKYKERKPGIYTEFDEHMKQVLNMEFYRRIIAMCYN